MARPTTPHDPPAPDPNPERLSDRRFGLLLAGVLLVATVFPVIWGRDPRLWLVPAALVVLGLALGAPRALAIPHSLWLHLALLVNRVIRPVVIGIVFFGTITPIAWMMRTFGRDALRLRLEPDAETYWEQRPARAADHMRDQF